MINFSEIKPGSMVQDPVSDIPELLQYFLSRIQFVPNIRFAVGWRGMRPSERFQNGWTFKISDFKGIYGLYFNDANRAGDWAGASFGISYFPHPDEKLVERFSLAAAYQTQQPDYFDKIREFMAHPEMASLFEVGSFSLAVNNTETALILSLQALSRHKVIATDGVPLPDSEPPRYVIEPGGTDQNMPAFVIAYGLFKVLAATATFSLQQAPDFLRRDKWPGTRFSYKHDDFCEAVPTTWVNNVELHLGYGNADFEQWVEAHSAMKPDLIQTQTWKADQPYPDFAENALWWVAHQIDDLKAYDKRMMGIEDRPQLLVVTGFLGSGKTSFLQHFLEYQVQRDRFVAVLQNEFGEVGLDGKLLDQSYSVTELNEGTVCCTLAGEMRPAISNIISRFQPDMIVLETSGATNPIHLREDFLPLSEMVRFDSITTVVDASNYAAIDSYEVAADQITAADLIVLNKADRVDAEELERITRDIRSRNPHAPVHPTTQGYINPGLIYDFDIAGAQEMHTKRKGTSSQSARTHSHRHDGISSVKVEFNQTVDMNAFIQVMDSLPPSVFRLKGIVGLGSGQVVLVQYVGGHYDISNFSNPNVSDRFLMVIGHELDSTIGHLEALK